MSILNLNFFPIDMMTLDLIYLKSQMEMRFEIRHDLYKFIF